MNQLLISKELLPPFFLATTHSYRTMEIKASSPQVQRILQAAADGDLDLISTTDDESLSFARCTSGCSALHWAAGTNHQDIVDYLIVERGWNVNQQAIRKAKGRTPLHYAARNGWLPMVQHLIQQHGAKPNVPAKHAVTPFQLAVWKCHVDIAAYLVEQCGVDPHQTNDFDCGAVHWFPLAPLECAGQRLDRMAAWLSAQALNFGARQQQGHTSLHKAAWQGHEQVCRYLHQEHDLWDDVVDQAGNYAADLADMAATERHKRVAEYLRQHCSRQRAESCAVLGIDPSQASDWTVVRRAYLAKAKLLHPDRKQGSSTDFDIVHKAYHHLMHEKGRGSQSNPAHSLPLMLECAGSKVESNDDCFPARLTVVLLEYGDRGLDVSNVKKKWKQVWTGVPFPETQGRLSQWIRRRAGSAVEIATDDKGCLRLYPRHGSRSQVLAVAATKGRDHAERGANVY